VKRERKTARLSRDYAVLVSRSGLVTIAGGKWTTYRRMGEDAVNAAVRGAGLERRPSRSETLRLHAWTTAHETTPHRDAYGADNPRLTAMLEENVEWTKPLHPRLPYCAGEVVWAARNEMARTVEDTLARRTRALLLDASASLEIAPEVAALLAKELGRDEQWEKAQVSVFRTLAGGYLPNRPQNELPPGN
jgi:glycerol-3-phosphate dehydrogenase